MSDDECEAYRRMHKFFLPSFTSTSCGEGYFDEKDTLLKIYIPPDASKRVCMVIQPDQSKFDEQEVLLSSYNIYQFVREKREHKKRIIEFTVLNY
jgi:hypothetical protein